MHLLDLHFRSSFQQAAGVGMLRMFGNLLGRTDFDDLAAIHHRDTRREITHDRHGVGDEKIGQTQVALQLREQVDDLRADADIECGDRFVGDDEPGMQSEGTGDANALALSSAEFVGEALQNGFVEADSAHQFDDAGSNPSFRAFLFVDEKRLGDDFFDAEAGIERGEGILKDDLHITAEASHLAQAGGEQVAVFKADAAGSGLDQAEEQTSERALTRP
jgi:hypothetical protein